MVKKTLSPFGTYSALSTRGWWRVIYLFITLAAVTTSIWLLNSQDMVIERHLAASNRAAWTEILSSINTQAALDPAAVIDRFSIRRGINSKDMQWNTTTIHEVQTTVLALEASKLRLTEIKIARDGGHFVINAETTP